MKILLVYPEMPDTFWAMKHFVEVVGKKASYPPLGLLTIAAMLPNEWEVKLIDMNADKLVDRDLLWADYVFISAMNVQEYSVKEIVIRCQDKGVKMVGGGSLFTHEHERFPAIDHFILNEGELTFPEFIADLEEGQLKTCYSSKKFADMHQTPIPAFHLADMSRYLYAIVQYSRGCPYLCDFCDVTALFGRKPRTKTSKQIIAELDLLMAQGDVQMVLFADDNLIGNKRILKSDLLPALIEWRKQQKPPFFFATQLTINLADDDELMELMIDAGFRHIFIGIETPDGASLLLANKKQNLKRDQLTNIHRLHAAGFIVSGGFIVGFDSDDETIFQRQADFIQKSGIPLPIVNVLKAPPGTELFDRMKAEGRIIREFAFSEGETNLRLIMNGEIFEKGFRRLLYAIYAPENVYQRIINFLDMYQPAQTNVPVPPKVTIKGLWGVTRIIYWLLWCNPNSRYFWKLIRWTWKNKRKLMDQAGVYAIMMYQMQQTYESILDQLAHQKQVMAREVDREKMSIIKEKAS